jgi:hypothetical protein
MVLQPKVSRAPRMPMSDVQEPAPVGHPAKRPRVAKGESKKAKEVPAEPDSRPVKRPRLSKVDAKGAAQAASPAKTEKTNEPSHLGSLIGRKRKQKKMGK